MFDSFISVIKLTLKAAAIFTETAYPSVTVTIEFLLGRSAIYTKLSSVWTFSDPSDLYSGFSWICSTRLSSGCMASSFSHNLSRLSCYPTHETRTKAKDSTSYRYRPRICCRYWRDKSWYGLLDWQIHFSSYKCQSKSSISAHSGKICLLKVVIWRYTLFMVRWSLFSAWSSTW